MNSVSRIFEKCLFTAAASLCVGTFAHAIESASLDAAHQQAIREAVGTLPLAFEENRGQADPAIKFLARGPGYQVLLTQQEAVMVFSQGRTATPQDGKSHPITPEHSGQETQSAVVRMHFEGANPASTIKSSEQLSHKSNYFLGADSAKQFTDIPNHARVKYEAIYPGVDLLYYGNQQQLEYDLVIAPRANPEQIKWKFTGVDKIAISGNGDLIVGTSIGDVTYHKPIAYQENDGQRQPVAAEYVVAKNGQVAFRLGAYDIKKQLIIDPVVGYSSFVWGTAGGIAVDAAGNVYIGGTINSTDLPATGGYQSALAGGPDAYVVKFDPILKKIVYATYLGVRRSSTFGLAIGVDAAGSAYIAGTPYSASFPVTSGAYQTTYAAGASFVTKFNATGNALAYSTFVNGVTIAAIAIDGSGNAFMTGSAGTIQTTAGAFQGTNPSGATSPFVAELNATGTAMSYATYVGGAGTDVAKAVAVDASGSAYITGQAQSPNFPISQAFQAALKGTSDAFVTKLNPTGTGLVYSTFLGGSDKESGNGIAIDATGQAFIVGQTYSADFPVTTGVFQPTKGYPGYTVSNGFITKLSVDGAVLTYSTFLGGNWCSVCWSANYDNDAAVSVAVDAAGYAYVGGIARSPAFKIVDAFEPTVQVPDGSGAWPFVAKISPLADRLVYSTFLGENSGYDKHIFAIKVDLNGNAYALGDLLGGANLDLYPTTAGALLTTGSPATTYFTYFMKLSTGNYPTSVLSSGNPAISTQPITFTAQVLSAKPNGTVTFMDGAATLGTSAMANDIASLTTTLAVGVHKITAVYSVDGAVSPPLFQIVNSR